MKFVIDDKIPFIKGVFEKFGEVEYLPGKEIKERDVHDADALITRTRTKCNEDLLNGSQVKIVASATIGYDHIDTQWCEGHGIEWTNAPGCNSGSVMQYIASVFSLLVLDKNIDTTALKTGVVGVGNVGSKVSGLAKAFGMQVFEIDPPRQENEPDKKFYSLHDVAGELDIITFHTPLTREGRHKTFHLFNEELLSKLKKDVLIINSSRGEVVDNSLLKNALKKGDVNLAVLDVWENEPDIDLELLDKVWLGTPHIAGYSQDGKANGTMMSVHAVSKKLGLQIDTWQPSGVPEPEKPVITIDTKGLSETEIISKAVLHTYDIRNDDRALREAPEKFEYLRGAYPVRREFFAYKVELSEDLPDVREKLSGLGFNV
jgi:erythronate-4-phosphate dehydrogenase